MASALCRADITPDRDDDAQSSYAFLLLEVLPRATSIEGAE